MINLIRSIFKTRKVTESSVDDDSSTDDDENCIGCFYDKDTNKQIPLKEIKVSIDVQGYLVNVSSALSYENSRKSTIEAIFSFPVDENSAVYKFEAEIDGKLIKAECQEKKNAKETYEKAVQEGYNAYYLGENDSTSDIFTCKVGNLPPKKEATVKFAYVSELTLEEDGSLKFVLPTLLNPRYTPSDQKACSTETYSTSYVKGCHQPYRFDVEVTVQGLDKVMDIKSIKDNLDISYKNERHTALLKLSKPFIADHDFEFTIQLENVHVPRVLVERGVENGEGFLKQDVVMLNFFPFLKDSCLSYKHEFIFVIDRSGSMSGSKIEGAKESLKLFMKSLPKGCVFNIIGFGSHFETLFQTGCQPYSETNLNQALKYQKTMSADMGGTEILVPLEYIYNKPPAKFYTRQLLLITDGKVSNTGAVIQLVKRHSDTTRVFTLGIGEGTSTSLIKGVARAGKGKAAFVKYGEKMQPVVMRLLKFAMQSPVTDVSIDWKLDESPELTQMPSHLPAIFHGDRLIVYASSSKCSNLNGSITLKGKIGEKELQFPLEVGGTLGTASCNGGPGEYLPIHRMAAKVLIKQLQDSDDKQNQNKSAIVLLSLASNVISNYTAMVGINKEKTINISNYAVMCNIPNIGDPSSYKISKKKSFKLHLPQLKNRKMNKLYSRCDANSIICIPIENSSNQFGNAGPSFEDSKGINEVITSDRYYIANCFFSNSEVKNEFLAEIPPLGKSSKSTIKDLGKSIFSKIADLFEFDGYWKFSDELASLISIESDKFKSSPCKNIDLWITAIVLTYLRSNCADIKEEWELIETKVIDWMNEQDLEGRSVDDLFKMVKESHMLDD